MFDRYHIWDGARVTIELPSAMRLAIRLHSWLLRHHSNYPGLPDFDTCNNVIIESLRRSEIILSSHIGKETRDLNNKANFN